MIEVYYGNRRILMPEAWHELKAETIAIFVQEFFQQFDKLFAEDPETGRFYSKDVVSFDAIRVKLLQSMLKLSNKDFERIGINQRHDLLNRHELVEFMFQTDMQVPNVPVLRRRLRRWYGPTDFARITAEEFSFADAACTNYIKTRNPKMLDTLVAILYRERKWGWAFRKKAATSDGDCRQPFNRHLIESRLRRMKGIRHEEKLAAFWWFHSQRAQLPGKFPEVFSKSNQESADKYGWLSIILALSTSGPFGNYNQTAATPFHLILTDLDAKAAQTPKSK